MSDKNKVRIVGYIAMAAVAITLAIMEHPFIALFVIWAGFDSLS